MEYALNQYVKDIWPPENPLVDQPRPKTIWLMEITYLAFIPDDSTS